MSGDDGWRVRRQSAPYQLCCLCEADIVIGEEYAYERDSKRYAHRDCVEGILKTIDASTSAILRRWMAAL